MSLHYVPAGIEAYSERTAQIYIKTKTFSKEKTKFGQKTKKWYTRDKLVIEAMSSNKGAIVPSGDFDRTFSIFSPAFIKACGLRLVLANPEVGKDYKKHPYEALGVSTIVDSGGFQLLRANVDFVHPDKVIKRYNKEANIGMPLDLPVRAKFEAAYFDKVSNLIRANDTYILSKLKPGIELALISHGSTLERRIARLDVLDRKAKVVAIAGLGIKPPPGVDRVLAAVENLMYVISRYHKTAKYFHVLGVTSKLWLFIYALLDKSGYVNAIGADSVSHRLGALVGTYDTYDFQSIDLLKNKQYKTRPLCNCPVCSSIGDLRIIQSWRLLEAHNLWVRAKQTELIGELAELYLARSVTLQEVIDVLKLNIDLNKLTTTVNYVEKVMDKKFFRLRSNQSSKGLFNKGSKLITDEHYEKVIKHYEKFHGKKF